MKKTIIEKIHRSNKNVLISGNLSAGKTFGVGFPLVEKIINEKENFCILDSKEEYLNQFYNSELLEDYNVIVINLRDIKKSEGWNPFEVPYELFKNGEREKASIYLSQLTETLYYSNEAEDPFWSQSAGDLFTGITLGLFEDAKREETNISGIYNFLTSNDVVSGNEDYLKAYFKNKDSESLAYKYASSIVFAPMETKGSIVSVAKQHIKYITNRELICKLLSKTTFEITEKPTSIFFVGKDEEDYINNVATMFFTQLFTLLIDKNEYKKFNLILDNFDSINYFNRFTEIISAGPGRNIKFVLFTRSIEVLENKYGKYINCLCDKVELKNNKINLIIDDESTVCENKYDVSIRKSQVNIKNKIANEVELFSIKNDDLIIASTLMDEIDQKISILEKELID